MPFAIYDNTTKKVFSKVNDGEQVASDATLAALGRTKKQVVSIDGIWDTVLLDFVVPPPKPIAKITTKDANGVAQTLFTTAQSITIRAEIWKPDNSAIMTGFAGVYPVPFFDSNGREHYVKMTFANGVAEVTVAAGKLQPSKYRATKASSSLADVTEHEIIVALNGA